MRQRISLINKSSGKFTEEVINGRDHIVTTMMAIEGDSVMNELLYPNAVVAKAAPQLEMLPAPDGHPLIDGTPVSAFNPLAINAANFGGFTRSPRINGKQVLTDLVVDVDVANRSERGKKIIKKIKSGERIGVSTGLVADVTNAKGKIGKQKFSGKVSMINFDHVAVLLDNQPAGENTYTLNHGVIKTTKSKGIFMDTLELDLSPLAVEDRILLSKMTVNELLSHIKHEITASEAKAIVEKSGLQVNSLKPSQVEQFEANAADFKEFIEKKSSDRKEVVDFIIENSKMDKDQLAGMSDAAVKSLSESVAPKNMHIANGKRASNDLELLNDDILIKEA